jgi:hypothetical protein
MRKIYTFIMVIVLLLFLVSGAFASKCMFVSSSDPVHSNDVILYQWLENLAIVDTIDIATGTAINNHYYFIEEFEPYDFIFVSETINSSDTEDLKGAPAPIFYTELWATKTTITGWCSEESSPDYYANTNSSETVVKILNGDHPLAAGFSTGTEITMVTGSEGTDYLVYSRPQIDYIPIAALTTDETKIIVLGVEKGTTLYNDDGVLDESLVSQNRCAAVGINANSNNYLTDEAFALMEAGINWLLEDPSAGIEDEVTIAPSEFKLDQNYPNPFNPVTKISFTLKKSGHTTLTVYDILGKEVTTLVDGIVAQGTHVVDFDASNFNSGIYFYKLVSGDFSETRKMMLIK